ncbi:MAG: hypothetical protein HC875_29315 [Anaerolineales bacterium]|nr:hypothetical protein [Anaerolineales bacterium]
MTFQTPSKNILILIKGAGDLASGAAYRLKRSGFPLIMTELPAPPWSAGRSALAKPSTAAKPKSRG